MRMTRKVRKILDNYEATSPGVKAKLCWMLMSGRLAGSGRMIILPVDQGFEHGPARSFAPNPAAYDPHYHYSLAVEAGLNALAAPLGLLEAGADTFAGQIPTILKMNSANSLTPSESPKDQAIYGSIGDALRLGCAGVGFTIFPGSSAATEMIEEVAALAEEAKHNGLAVVVWSYPRGEALTSAGETALDVVAYAAHMACLVGAHIVKVKLPSAHLEQDAAKKAYKAHPVAAKTAADRVRHVMQAAFAGRRMVVFSGGAKRGADSVFEDARAIHEGGGNGSIIGRNTFQRERQEAMNMLGKLVRIYQSKDP